MRNLLGGSVVAMALASAGACVVRSTPPRPDATGAPQEAARPAEAAGTARRALPDEVPPTPREFRGIWVATVDNIDWPSRPGLPVAEQKRELEGVLDAAQRLRCNALVFQVRTVCDALYPSRLEPWSEWLTGRQGHAPEPAWDPLAAVIEGAHARGIEVHAWFNPYRARHPAAKSPNAASHVASVRPDLVVEYGRYQWLDPGNADAEQRTLAVIEDVVRRYDLDGVHIDDYFYPYPERGKAFPDEASYARHRARGGRLELADWRRDNVNRMVRRIHETVRKAGPRVKFGISPFGIARPGLPKGIQAGIDQHAQLYADTQLWLREGWCDYFAPQLYWPIAQRAQSFPVLLEWWTTQNPRGRHLWPGLYTSKAGGGGKEWSAQELVAQVQLARTTRGAGGAIHFSAKALVRDSGGVATALRNGPYAMPALVPASPWLDAEPPGAARPRGEGQGSGRRVRWEPVRDAFVYTVHARRGARFEFLAIVPSGTLAIAWPEWADAIAVAAVDRTGNEGPRTIAH